MQCLANVWATLSDLGVWDINSEFWKEFVGVLNENKLPNLKDLWLSYGYDILDISLLKLQADNLPSLKRLHLSGFIYSGKDIQGLADRLVKWDLKDLRLNFIKGISGHLFVLFRYCLSSLTHLGLSSCELTSRDMRCLTEAREQGRLPRLKHLDVSLNRIKNPKMCNKNEAWKNVEISHYRQEVP